MAKSHRPRRGSLAYKPRKRAKKQTPRITSWKDTGEVKPLGFAGYKAGMTHVLAINNKKTGPTAGLEIFVPVTILDAPPMHVAAIRAYRAGYINMEAAIDIYAEKPMEDLKRKVDLPKETNTVKKLKELEGGLNGISDIRLIVSTQPTLSSIEKKKPDLMEIAIGGSDIAQKLEYAKSVLGKEITAEDVLSTNKYFDVTSVSKGKGVQGIIKRLGVTRQPRKNSKGVRHGGSGGPWNPARKLWLWPLPGQMGYHKRTEYNKLVMKIGPDGNEVTPNGGFVNYGLVRGSYIMVYGSVPGATKRLIRLSTPRRARKDENFEITHIDQTSKQGV